jgi:hypothetical protein
MTHTFTDFKAAYDIVGRNKLFMAWDEFEIPK